MGWARARFGRGIPPPPPPPPPSPPPALGGGGGSPPPPPPRGREGGGEGRRGRKPTVRRSSSLTGQRLQQRADCRPELFLDLDGNGVRKPVRCLATCFHRSEDADGEFPVRIVPVSSPVPSQQGRPDPGDL